jgi:hypothetical protein
VNGPAIDGSTPNGGGGGGGGDGGGGGGGSGSSIRAFRLVLFYGALAGELLGKQVNFVWGFRLSAGTRTASSRARCCVERSRQS